jgi:SAM-dependent methyltransferase
LWNGTSFDANGIKTRVLAYDVSPSGWTDALTQLHDKVGEGDHFIEAASRRHTLNEVKRAIQRPQSVLLEIGVSSGVLLRELLVNFPEHDIVGADYTRGTLNLLGAKVQGVPLLQFDLTRCPLPNDCIDVVIALNVLEHIADDGKAVAELFRILKPGGHAVVEVPTGPSLYDVYDRALMHHRRYTLRGLVDLFERAGFRIERRSHLGCTIYPAFYVCKRLNQLRYNGSNPTNEREFVSDLIVTSGRARIFGKLALRFEEKIRRYFPVPWGIRCLLSAEKVRTEQYESAS